MLTYNDKIHIIKTSLKIDKCVKGEHSITVIKCAVLKKMNMGLKNSFD